MVGFFVCDWVLSVSLWEGLYGTLCAAVCVFVCLCATLEGCVTVSQGAPVSVCHHGILYDPPEEEGLYLCVQVCLCGSCDSVRV